MLRFSLIVAAWMLPGVTTMPIAMAEEAQAPALTLEQVAEGFGTILQTDRAVYRAGEPIYITFEVFNHTPRPIRFDFNSGQRFDVVIEDADGIETWRWSRGRMFTTALAQETLGTANPRLTYEIEYKADLAPGRYRIMGLLTDTSGQVSAMLSVNVK